MGRLSTKGAREQKRRDELLSAYLDDELSAEERTRLEARLATDPALRDELDALRHTVALVRNLPTVPVPRNFILPQTSATTHPRMTRRQPRRARPQRAWLAPLLTAATAIVSLLFVVTLAGDLLLFTPQRMASAPEAELPQMALETSMVTEEVAAEVEKVEEIAPAATSPPEPMEAPSEPKPEAPPVDEAEESAPSATPLPRATEMPPTRLAEAPAEESATLEGDHTREPAEAAAGEGPMEEPTAPAAEEEEIAATPTAPPTATSEERADSAEPAPETEAEAGGLETVEAESEVPADEITEPAEISPWWAIEFALGLIALGLALATVWAWRARQHQR